MSHIVADRVVDNTSTTGTSAFVLGAPSLTGYRNIRDVCADGDTIWYSVAHRTLSQWEVGKGTYGAGTGVLTRTTILTSSNAGSAVNFSAGFKDIVAGVPAQSLALLSSPSSLTTLAIADDQADFLQVYDTSAGEWKKVLGENLGYTSPHGVFGILRTLNGKMSEIISIADWNGASGAVGIGGNDTAAFNAAREALPSTGGTILLPAPPVGYYRTEENILINKDGVKFAALGGSGGFNKNFDGSVIIKYYGPVDATGSMFRVGNQADHIVGFEMENVGLDGRDNIGHLLRFTDAQQMRVRGGRFIDGRVDAFVWDNGSAPSNPCGFGIVDGVTVEMINTNSSAGDGFRFNGTGSTGVTGVSLLYPRVRFNNGHGIRITQGDGYRIETPYCFRQPGGTGYGIQIDGPHDGSINGIISHPIMDKINVVSYLDKTTTIRLECYPADVDAPVLSGTGANSVTVSYLDGRKTMSAKGPHVIGDVGTRQGDIIQVAGDHIASLTLRRLAFTPQAGEPAATYTTREWYMGLSSLGDVQWVDVDAGIERMLLGKDNVLTLGQNSAGSGGSFRLRGATSGIITINPQAAAGTYNFNLPTTAGTSGLPLLSGGGGAAAQTYGQIATAAITDANVTYAKIANGTGLSVFGRSANSAGVNADIAGTDGQALRVSGTALGFGTIVAAGIASDAVTTAKILNNNVTLAKLAQGTALSVLGVTGNATANYADIVAGSDAQVMRRSGTAVGFGSIDLTSSATATAAWSTYSPTISASTGSITSSTVQRARYVQIGKTVTAYVQFFITTNGTGATALLVSLPVTGANGFSGVGFGWETVTGNSIQGTVGTATCSFTKTGAAYPGADSGFYGVEFTYEAA